jgi:hypothetical protein
MKLKFSLAIEFFRKFLSPLDTLTTVIQGPDSSLHTIISVSDATIKCWKELRENFDDIISSVKALADANSLGTDLSLRRSRKVSRRLDRGAK